MMYVNDSENAAKYAARAHPEIISRILPEFKIQSCACTVSPVGYIGRLSNEYIKRYV